MTRKNLGQKVWDRIKDYQLPIEINGIMYNIIYSKPIMETKIIQNGKTFAIVEDIEKNLKGYYEEDSCKNIYFPKNIQELKECERRYKTHLRKILEYFKF